MNKVYDFFGFGERIKTWLGTIGTGRTACIQYSPGINSEEFSLEKGHAQGDSPSPILYNLAAQIIIFRIELDPSIERVQNNIIDAPLSLIPTANYKDEGFGQTCVNESFADDSSNVMMLTVESLTTLKHILEEFRFLSGLSCNLEKSFAMRIGSTDEALSNEITALGFSFVNRIKLLGFTLQNYGDITAANFEVITTKLENISRFWERFNLSITGKLSIYKSLMLPQVNYVATILTPCDNTIKRIEQITENFVARGVRYTRGDLPLHPPIQRIFSFNLNK
jgi:hypothetical protein